MTTTSGGPSRRTLVKGAAWSIPVVAVGSAAPVMAASPDPGLNGWVVISRQSYRSGRQDNCRVRYDGYRNGDATYNGTRLGLWVWDARSSEITTAPSLTIHLPYAVTWSLDNGNNGWSLPQSTGQQDADGFFLYRSTYFGGYIDQTGSDGLPEVVLTGRPHFVGTRSGSCSNNRRQKITRSVGINGVTIAFTREVSFPNSFNNLNETNPNVEEQSTLSSGPDAAATTAGPADAAISEPSGESIQHALG